MIISMESVTLRVYREGNTIPKKFGADLIRANGERVIITTRERASSIARDKGTMAVHDCQWEPFSVREDGIMDVGHGLIDKLAV